MSSKMNFDGAAMNRHTVAVIGGGISGMSAAYRLLKDHPDTSVVLIESKPRLGGVLQSEQIDGYLVEHSADMFTVDPDAALQLCVELGMESELLQTLPVADRAYVSSPEGIFPVPRGLALMLPNQLDSILDSHLLSNAAKSRFQEEESIPPRMDNSDESLQSFAVRRFGAEMFERLIQPLTSGIYSADPECLSMQATMNRFIEMERTHGSLIAAGRSKTKKEDQTASGARYGMFRSPTNGFQSLVDRLRSAIDGHNDRVQIQTGAEVTKIARGEQRWRIKLSSSVTSESTTESEQAVSPNEIDVDSIVLATSAQVSSKLLEGLAPALSFQLGKIQTASMTIVAMGIDDSQMGQPFDGFGIVVPAIENRELIAVSFSSNKFSGRSERGKTLVRCFIGGTLSPQAIDRSDQELVGIAREELNRFVGFSGEPEFVRVIRWPNAMPQYHLGHLDRVNSIEALSQKIGGLELAGNSYHGVGIPACIVSGFTAAKRIMSSIN